MRPDYPARSMKPGTRERSGDQARVAASAPREIIGGQGTTVTTIGGRAIIKTGQQRGGGGLSVATVLALPAIPSSGARFVFWTSAGGGTGDNQMWCAYAGQAAWTPMQKITSRSGVPV